MLDARASNAWLGAVVVLLGLWLMRGGLKPGLSFHMLGATVLTLLMGPWLAMLGLAVLLLALAAGGHGDWLALGLDWLCDAAVPVAVTAGLLQLARRKLPAQLFVYVFINAFIAGGLSLFCSALAGMLVLGSQAVYPGITCWKKRRFIFCCPGPRPLPVAWLWPYWWYTARTGSALLMMPLIWGSRW
jgi:uncharacterized membrane protein